MENIQTVPFNTLDFKELPSKRLVFSITPCHPLFAEISALREEMRIAGEEKNAQLVVILFMTMQFRIAAYEN